MKKRTFYTEVAYLAGVVLLALGTAFMERADFGMSMVVAPAYLLYLKLSQTLPFFTFGMAEYALQAVLLLLMTVILKRAKFAYLFSFLSAVLYGLALDGAMALFSLLPGAQTAERAVCYLLGMPLCAMGVSLLFHTYIPPEAYELFVKEIALKRHADIHKCKTAYDCVSCLVGILMSFAFFGLWHFEGIKLGTIFCALINGTLIGGCTKILEKGWDFQDALPFRGYFT